MATDTEPEDVGRQPDVVLLVEERWGATERLRLSYTVHRAGGAVSNRHETVEFAATERHLVSLRNTLDGLRTGTSARGAQRRLLGIARQLTERLVPPAVRECLETLGEGASEQASDPAPSMLVVSEASWLPFELLLVDRESEQHWCQAFAISRWLPGRDPCRSLGLRCFAMVVDPRRDLPDLARERRLVGTEMASERVDLVRQDDLLLALDHGAFDVFHFAGHAATTDARADDWRLEIGPGLAITAADVNGLGPGFAARRPFIFLNACSSARGGESWGRAGGMAATFVQAGARAVIGASWPVTDVLATEFAVATYGALRAGQPLGAAVRQARAVVRDLAPADATWLAYAVYGHPHAQHSDEAPAETSGLTIGEVARSIGVPSTGSDAIGLAVQDAIPKPSLSADSPLEKAPVPFHQRLIRRPISRVMALILAVAAVALGTVILAPRGVDRPLAAASDALPASEPLRRDRVPEGHDVVDAPIEALIEAEVREGAPTQVKMIPAWVSVRFEEEEGLFFFVLTASLGGGKSVKDKFWQRNGWEPLVVDTANGRWRISVTRVDSEGKRIWVDITKETV